jgi:predicted ATPase
MYEAVMKHLHVITGGPGSGKTSLVAALAANGLDVMPEVGRAIIQNEVRKGGRALPWDDREAFAAMMFAAETLSYRKAIELPGPVVFDRGIPDVIGYLRLCGLPVHVSMMEAAKRYRYAKQVFVAPPWLAIFEQDTERKQSPREAEATYDAMVEVYSELEYELVPLPLVPIEERVKFVTAGISLPRGHQA